MMLLSGGFDGIHIGHVRMIRAARRRSEVVIALNSDDWLFRKKGYVLIPWAERREILEAFGVSVEAVDDQDGTVCEALRRIRPTYFGNGGDRKTFDPKEHAVCEELGIIEVFGLGGEKVRSSSDYVPRRRFD